MLPEYEGKIKCIYIDPPYNTGASPENGGWVYYDNVDDPKIKKWLGDVVGQEGDDLSRHDKWLCMMYPRLKLLQKLLSDDGAIFISIDDNEQANLKLICNEIFGSGNFVATIANVNNPKGRSDDKYIATAHEYILIYRKSELTKLGGFEPDEIITKRYNKKDSDGRLYREIDLRKTGENDLKEDRPNMFYYFYYNKETGEFYPSKNPEIPQNFIQIKPLREDGREGRWRWGFETTEENINKITPKFMAVRNIWGIMEKDYLDERDKVKPTSAWTSKDVNSERGTELFVKYLGFDKSDFYKPKPIGTIERIIEIATNKDSIILDSFAGSGTTAHAVLNMNKKDGGNRKFILIEMMDYADTITAERVKRVVKGYSKDREDIIFDKEITLKELERGAKLLSEAKQVAEAAKNEYSQVKKPIIKDGHLQVSAVSKAKDQVEGLGGDFSFYELGEAMLLSDGNLNEKVDTAKIREYIWYMETRAPFEETNNENPYYLGSCNNTGYYFFYEKESVTTLSHDFLSTIKEKSESYLIYADICTIPEDELRRYNITFKKIPRDIVKL